ncbi:unnamed protein product [Linum tenue]|uniref:Cytochrome P450 n=1 Tax=Linum tenue TaxID=586396 RepID=A0AAV0N9Z2_9ROSI|nr:unnamed protein product [Linum tenue]CAI0456033.1 unnamed protein product [Linum tenue]
MALYLLLLTFAITILIVITASRFLSTAAASKHRLPPGPKPWPIIGNIPHLGKQIHVSLQRFSQLHGPLISLRLGSQLLIVASSPAAAAEILRTHDRLLSARYVTTIVPYDIAELDRKAIVWSSNCNNERWKAFRSMFRNQIFSARAIESQASVRERKVAQMVEYLDGKLGEELFSAGTDTSVATIEWAMAELMRNRRAMDKLREELKAELSQSLEGKPLIDESEVSRLPYLSAIVKETLRLHPPAPLLLPHRAQETCEVMNYVVPKGAQVLVNVWAISRDPTVWEDPMSFKPERFIGSQVDFRGQDFKLLPFSAGRRMCPGVSLATRQIPLVLTALVRSFDWCLSDGEDETELDMSEKFGTTLEKERPLLLVPSQSSL